MSRRAAGIDYDRVPTSLVARVLEPGDAGYSRFTSTFIRSGSPGIVLRPTDGDAVGDAVRFAAAHPAVPLGIYSAGHGISGRSTNHGGIVIDVSAINHVEVLAGRRVRIGPGARWIDVARVLTPSGLAITSGDYGGVGVGGLATAGGLGWFAREHGLTIDHLRSVEVVTATGELIHTSDAENPDLFWAMRGAGANFGVAVSFEFEAKQIGRVAFGEFVYQFSSAAPFLERWGNAIETSHRSVTAELLLGATRSRGPNHARASVVVDSDDANVIAERLQPLLHVAPIVQQQISITTYEAVMGAHLMEGPQQGRGEPLSHSALVRHLDAEVSAELGAMLDAKATHFFYIRSAGGAVRDVPPDATAWAWRDVNFSLAASGSPHSGLNDWWERLQPFFEGMYLSFESDVGPAVVARAFPPAHLARLQMLKRRYDGAGVFRDNFFIDPDEQ